MMREIKFRGKRIDNGKWIYGSLIIEEDPIADAFKYFIKPFNFLRGKLVVPETVGQYTGRKDKNGKEIYEGDIVLIDTGDSFLEIKQQYVVRYDSMNASYCFETNNGDKIYLTSFGNPDFFIKNKVEVIGNIYENPELIVLLSDDA